VTCVKLAVKQVGPVESSHSSVSDCIVANVWCGSVVVALNWYQ